MFAKLVCADGFRPQKSELKEIKKYLLVVIFLPRYILYLLKIYVIINSKYLLFWLPTIV